MSALAFGIYVHWPYCAAKCPYCDFNSHVRPRPDEARWVRAIRRELEAVADLQGQTRPAVGSVFFGGGTPSLMSGAAAARVLDHIAALWPMATDAEVTLEANPNSVEQKRFEDYRAAGVNRVSIGVQALDEAALKRLGRLHGVEEAKAAIRQAIRIFPRVSFDLIYARPGQTLAEWNRELDEALAFGTEHLSLYQLTVELGTAYAARARQGKLRLPDEEAAAGLFDLTQAVCAGGALPAYEVSNHARPGAECRHNLLYWRYQDYAAVGPGAHGRLTLHRERVATEAERLPEKWLEGVERRGSSLRLSTLSAREAAEEHLLMAMRLTAGVELQDLARRWGLGPSADKVASLVESGMVTKQASRLAATARGRLVLNAVLVELCSALREEVARTQPPEIPSGRDRPP